MTRWGVATGATGSLTVIAKPEKNDRGVYVVTASYSDAGAKGQPALTGHATVTLRSRYVTVALPVSAGWPLAPASV